jgi:hypothetical protein
MWSKALGWALGAAGLLGVVLATSWGGQSVSPLNAVPDELRLPGDAAPANKPQPPAPSDNADKAATGKRTGVDLLTAPPLPTRWGEGFGTRAAPAKPAPQTPVAPKKPVPPPVVPVAVTAPASAPAVEKKADLPPGMLPPLYPSAEWPPAYGVRGASGTNASLRAAPVQEKAADRIRPEAAAPPPTEGVLTLSSPPVARDNPARVTVNTRPMQSWQLKRHVRAACGSTVKDVQVVQQADNSFLVKVRVDDAIMQRRATELILALPEMHSPQVHLNVLVAH